MDILFKAKRLDNGEWVEGYYLKYTKLLNGEIEHRIFVSDSDGIMWYEVHEDTICRYAGLTDKNGNKIWENDVCYYDDMDVCVVRFGEYDNNTGHKHVGFYTAWRKYKDMYRSDIGFWVKERELEVIGNIFDNPELLENE